MRKKLTEEEKKKRRSEAMFRKWKNENYRKHMIKLQKQLGYRTYEGRTNNQGCANI